MDINLSSPAPHTKPNPTKSPLQGLPIAAPRHLSSGRKNATIACTNCRRKRTKCSGGPPPCVTCAKFNGKCCFDTYLDRRTKASRRQRLEEIENDHQILKNLLALLQDNPDMGAAEIITHLPQEMLDPSCPNDAAESVDKIPSNRLSPCPTGEGSLQTPEDTPTYRDSTSECSEDASVRKRGRSPSRDQPSSRDTPRATYMAPDAVELFGNFATINTAHEDQLLMDMQARQLDVIYARPETCLPLNVYIESGGMVGITTNAVLSFQNAARSQIAQGVAVRKVLSMDTFDLDLFRRDRRKDDEHTVAGWACEWGKAWAGYPVELQLATIHYVGSLMRWLILPCKETYEMMSPLIRPLPSQLMIPHTVDIDLWGAPPIMREMLLLYGQGWLDRVTVAAQRLHWNRGPDLCTEKVDVPCSATLPDAIADGEGGFYRTIERFAPDFIVCIDNAESWTIHRDLLREMPELEGRVQFHDD